MPDSPWTWNSKTKKYERNGVPVSEKVMRDIRDDFIRETERDIEEFMTDLLLASGIALSDVDAGDLYRWETKMRRLIRNVQADQYMLGRGGRDRMTLADWGRVGSNTRFLYSYLRRFAGEIEKGMLTSDAARARAAMYVGAGVYAFERGRQAAFGVAMLPGYPGVGTSCLSNCRCWWDYRPAGDYLIASWQLEPGAKHCTECIDRSVAWAEIPISA